MGLRDDNLYVQIHRQVGWPGYIRELRHHCGDLDVSVQIPDASWPGLVSAAQMSDAIFFTTLANIPGSRDILVDVGAAGVSVLRQLVLDLDAH